MTTLNQDQSSQSAPNSNDPENPVISSDNVSWLDSKRLLVSDLSIIELGGWQRSESLCRAIYSCNIRKKFAMLYITRDVTNWIKVSIRNRRDCLDSQGRIPSPTGWILHISSPLKWHVRACENLRWHCASGVSRGEISSSKSLWSWVLISSYFVHGWLL